MNRRRLAVAVAASAALAPSHLRAQTDETECTYRASMLTLGNMLGWFFDEVSQQTTGVTAANFTDDQWKVDVLAPYAIAQAAQQVLADLSPPSSFTASHDLFVQSVDELVLAQRAMEQGVLSADVTAIDEATEHINRASALISQAAESLPA